MKIIKEIIPYIIIVIVVVLIRTFLVTPVKVQKTSMAPTLANGDVLILKKYDHSYKRFDIVVLKYNNERLIKRIIGLPGEEIVYKESKLYVDGKEVEEDFLPKDLEFERFDTILLGSSKIPKGYYFVVGDNRNNSLDSRSFGFVPKKDILGVTSLRIWPLKNIGKVN